SIQRLRREGRGAQCGRRRRCFLGRFSLRLGARRGLRRLLPVRQRLRRAGRLAPWLRPGHADPRPARLLPRARARGSAPRPGPVELPGSNPLVFDRGRSIGAHLVSWPAEHVVKCLVRYHPDEALETRLENEAQVRTLYEAVQVTGHELLLEIIPPSNLPRAADTVLRALKRFYTLG